MEGERVAHIEAETVGSQEREDEVEFRAREAALEDVRSIQLGSEPSVSGSERCQVAWGHRKPGGQHPAGGSSS